MADTQMARGGCRECVNGIVGTVDGIRVQGWAMKHKTKAVTLSWDVPIVIAPEI